MPGDPPIEGEVVLVPRDAGAAFGEKVWRLCQHLRANSSAYPKDSDRERIAQFDATPPRLGLTDTRGPTWVSLATSFARSGRIPQPSAWSYMHGMCLPRCVRSSPMSRGQVETS